MTRPRKATVDYFPHTVTHGKTMFILESKWGNDGYATWFKILEKLGDSDQHVIDLRDQSDLDFLAAYCRVSCEMLIAILDQCAVINAIERGLWRHKLVYCQHFVDGIADAYRRRKEKLPTIESVCLSHGIVIDGINPQATGLVTAETTKKEQSDGRKPQREREREREREIKTFLSDSKEIGLAEFLFYKIVERNPSFKKPNFQSWAKDIDLMIRRDTRSPDEIKKIILWCQGDPFWQNNILSTGKLREKYDQLYLKMKGNGNGIENKTTIDMKPMFVDCPSCGARVSRQSELIENGCVNCYGKSN